MCNCDNPYIPCPAEIIEITKHTDIEWTFRVKADTSKTKPGQFYEISLPKFGESPISVSGIGPNFIDFTIRAVGRVTNEIFEYDMDKSLESKSKDEIIDQVYEDLIKRYNEKEEIVGEEVFRRIERYIMLEVLDQKWRQHLKDLTELREGIRLRSYGQRNPIHDYKIVAFEIYNEMIDAIKRETGSFLLKLKLRNEEETANLKHEEAKNLKYEHIDNEAEDAETVEESPQRKLSRRERREMERKK